uniref:Uncharacterized protein n=1 Tax=Theropithecus gelada TaxID=9565 RepID=A0A8D2G5W0_THEGE
VATPSWALEEELIRASWLPHSLQLPGFLIDGDYYIIDLLDRTVPALGTLPPPRSLPQGLAPATQSLLPGSAGAPQERLRFGVGDPRTRSWDGAGAKRREAEPVPRRSQGRPEECGFISSFQDSGTRLPLPT